MKIDRLLSMVMYLLNRDKVTARELSEHYEVSVRTIQRDMDTLTFAGIPVTSEQGPHGGFGIMKSYKLDRQFVNTNDLYFMVTALESISTAYQSRELKETLEKVQTLTRDYQQQAFNERRSKLHIDFSDISISAGGKNMFMDIERAIEQNRCVGFNYSDSSFRQTERIVEPMTIVFKWFAWYLYGFCQKRNDYRLFRISRIRNLEMLKQPFQRKDMRFETFMEQTENMPLTEITLNFDSSLKTHAEDYFRGSVMIVSEKGILIKTKMPISQGLINMLLGYGDKVEIIEPEFLRQEIQQQCRNVLKKYQSRE